MRSNVRRALAPLALISMATATSLLVPTGAQAAVGTDTTAFRQSVTVDGIRAHQTALQAAASQNSGNRASGTPGYEASGRYVEQQMRAAGYSPTRQNFTFPYFKELAPAQFSQVSPAATAYDADDFTIMDYSGSGAVTAPLQAVNDLVLPPGATASSSNAGCEAADFSGFVKGNIALIQRGTCDFAVKAANALAAGAAGVVIFNEGQEGRQEVLQGTLGAPISIPVLGASFALGNSLAQQLESGPVTVRIVTSTLSENRQTFNIIANTTSGRTDRVVVVGAHLDSVEEGPGINDNGSGTGTILEIAEQIAKLKLNNQVRFAFWGAEESGLLGAEYYVSQLTARDKKNIALNLNFDMLGSRNYVRFVYDGDGNATGTSGPNGSGAIEGVFNDYFAARGLPVEPTAFDGRSDYGPFIDAGIPAGGLFSGAEGIKTAREAQIYGGTAGLAYDPCYHQACDDNSNVSEKALDELGDAAAHATLVYAQTTSAVNGTDKANSGKGSSKLFKGHTLRK